MVQVLEQPKKRTPKKKTFFQRYHLPIIGSGVVLVVIAGFLIFGGKGGSKRKSSTSVVSISMPPPPPPPPPVPTPPPQEPPPEPETKQEEFQEEQAQPEEAPAPDEPAPAMGSDIQGDGPADGFGLSGKGGGGLIGGNGKGMGAGGSKWGGYAAQVQSRVVEALRNHRKTRSATMSMKVRIWADKTGRVTKVTLEGASKDPAIDEAIRKEIFGGMQLSTPPPEGMPMPIVLRINATRPN